MSAPRVLIVGGSLGGLSAALSLLRAGCEVEVAERSPTRLHDNGAGLVVQPETLDFFEGPVGADRRTFSVATRERLFLDRDGGTAGAAYSPQLMTSWGALYHHLVRAIPAPLVHHGRRLVGLDVQPDGATATFADGSDSHADLLVCADGTGSTCRSLLDPGAVPTYAGYVAWRGVLPEADVPAALSEVFRERFVFFQGARTQALCYTIPGPNGEVDAGARQLNWLWYRNVPAGPALSDLLTGHDGHARERSVPAGLVPPGHTDTLLRDAHAHLPAVFAELIEATPQPFLQAITDLHVDQTVHGRAVLIGDAAFTPRPHTAASTSKAILDAVTLAHAVANSGDLDDRLVRWEHTQLRYGQALVSHGWRLGVQSGLGHS